MPKHLEQLWDVNLPNIIGKAVIDKPYGTLLGIQLSDDAHIDRPIDFLFAVSTPRCPSDLGNQARVILTLLLLICFSSSENWNISREPNPNFSSRCRARDQLPGSSKRCIEQHEVQNL